MQTDGLTDPEPKVFKKLAGAVNSGELKVKIKVYLSFCLQSFVRVVKFNNSMHNESVLLKICLP